MLETCRVLDLTDHRGLVCGQILRDLGADVIHVEPPGGSGARRVGPFAGDVEHPERSLHWWAYARGQRSIVLDLDDRADRDELLRLVRGADFLVESAAPGAMAARGIGYADLAAANPSLVHVSITPFGQNGPKAHWADSDLVLQAAGGPLRLNGDADRAPLRICVPQSYLHAGAEGALGALLAHHDRVRTGRGQHVDVSAQAAQAVSTQSLILAASNASPAMERASGGVRLGPMLVRFVYPARDGHVSITHTFGPAFGPATRRLMECVHDHGFCDEALRDKDWNGYVLLLLTGQEPIEEFERVKSAVAAFTGAHTRAELQRIAIERDLLLAPVQSIADVAESEQLRARDFWRPVRQAPLDRAVPFPGPFARFGVTALRDPAPAPAIGEHGDEIRAEAPRTPAVSAQTSATPPTPGRRPLEGVRILDLMWAIAGPQATRVLADAGAEVVRVESPRHTDACKTIAPFRNSDFSSPVAFYNYNAGKRMLTLDLTTDSGREVLLDLVRWADVVCESFTPGVMARFGLDYEALRAVKPDVIVLSTCLMGQTGPMATFAGYGNLAAAVTGFASVAGWPDRAPVGAWGAYTDYVAWRYNAIAILAALEHRRRTGEGQHVDLAQAETALHYLAPALLDHAVNGRVQSADGNDDPQMAPHGVYPAAGDDTWVAIAARDDAEWRALCDAIGRDDLAADPTLATLAGRRAARERIDAAIGAWTAARSPAESESLLQARGIAASAVQDSAQLCEDPQLLGRAHFATIEHPTHGTTTVESARFLLSETPTCVAGPAPESGADNDHVLAQILGYDEERVTELVVAGAFG